MNPTEVEPSDYRLYYNNTYMLHDRHGVVHIQVEDYQFLYKRIGTEKAYQWKLEEDTPQHLSCLWPSPRAINFESRALYIGRRARREARRSMTTNHYYVVWGRDSLRHRIVKEFVHPSDYPNLSDAIDELASQARDSTAISKDIILTNTLEVIARGHNVGQLVEEHGQHVYAPSLALSPLCKRTAFKLGKEGILCL